MTEIEEWAWKTNIYVSQIKRCTKLALVKIGFRDPSMTKNNDPFLPDIIDLIETAKVRLRFCSMENAPVQRVWHAALGARFEMVSETERMVAENLMFTDGAILLLTDCPLAGSALHAGIVDYAYKASVDRQAHGGA